MAAWAPPPDPPPHPLTSENEIYQRGPKLEVHFRYTLLFWPLTPPPPPAVQVTVTTQP